MERAEEVREGLVAAVAQGSQADGGVGVARSRLDELHVARRVLLQPQPGLREGDPPRQRERKQEREQLGPRIADELAAVVDVQHRPRDRHHLEAELGDEAADDRVRRREHVGADAESEVAAPLREDPPADALLRFEHERGQVAQVQRGREPRDATADDDDVPLLGHGRLDSSAVSGEYGAL